MDIAVLVRQDIDCTLMERTALVRSHLWEHWHYVGNDVVDESH